MVDFSVRLTISPGEMDLEEVITAALQPATGGDNVGSLPISNVEASAPSGTVQTGGKKTKQNKTIVVS